MNKKNLILIVIGVSPIFLSIAFVLFLLKSKIVSEELSKIQGNTTIDQKNIIIKQKDKDDAEITTTDNNSTPKSTEKIVIQTADGEKELFDPPTGFEWQRLEEINGWIVKPKGWYFRHKTKGSTQSYFITKEEIIGEDGFFETGLSMNVILSSEVPGGDAYKYAQNFFEHFRKNGAIDRQSEERWGAFSVFRILGTFQDSGVAFKMFIDIFANRNTNTFYLITFESLPDQWDAAWKIGQQILNIIPIDDEV